MGVDLGVKDQAVNCHPRPGVFPPASMCVMMVCECVWGVMEVVTLGCAPRLLGQAQDSLPRTLVFSASHGWHRSLCQEHRQVVLTLAPSKKYLLPLQVALPRSYPRVAPEGLGEKVWHLL